MSIRTFRSNFRTRGGIDTQLWNRFFRDLERDLNDLVGSGTDLLRDVDLGVPDFLDQYDIAVSGLAGKQEVIIE